MDCAKCANIQCGTEEGPPCPIIFYGCEGGAMYEITVQCPDEGAPWEPDSSAADEPDEVDGGSRSDASDGATDGGSLSMTDAPAG